MIHKYSNDIQGYLIVVDIFFMVLLVVEKRASFKL